MDVWKLERIEVVKPGCWKAGRLMQLILKELKVVAGEPGSEEAWKRGSMEDRSCNA